MIGLEEMVLRLQAQLVDKDKTINGLEVKLDILRKSDRVFKELTVAQKQLAKSSLALASKMKKSKFVTAHAVTYATTKPREEIKLEMIDAQKREMEKKRAKQKSEIDVMISAVDRIAAGYERYENVSTVITFSEPRSEFVPDHLFTWMEQDMIAVWLYTVEPTVEEQEKYEKHLQKQMRPDPIHSPDLPKARVNWHRLNLNMKGNLPVPDQFALHGCAQSPEFYTATLDFEHYGGQTLNTKLVFESGKPRDRNLDYSSRGGLGGQEDGHQRGRAAPPPRAYILYTCAVSTCSLALVNKVS